MYSGILFAIISPFLSSISTVFKGGAVKILGPFAVLSFGSLIGSIVLLLTLLIKDKTFDLKKIRENLKDLALLILTRQIFGELLFTVGLSLTISAKAIF